ncbi:CapA family protein [Paenibacillus chondroitinus]|uniref:CapA family protein n=1 Tax=Paenibacillus chondroitinus TaxID=59842 RepID=A0ABU6D957_9BACL|nr:CapA family protein [Paenibacillus chondroitinus]MCY9662459.1 CapA family protein [Paenibacillus anseongense]MEB4793427.1 CapA family protein [Paenibacillus chondroitinus]
MVGLIKITIAAVGDLLMKKQMIASAAREGGFAPIFSKVKPYLRKSDLTIGNLETTFSGKHFREKSGKLLFNSPDKFAATLRDVGFDVVGTANNHCMDGKRSGLRRTLNVLDRHGLRHTGTYRSAGEAGRKLIVNVKGIKIGILAYTKGTNGIRVPEPWLVNRLNHKKIIADVRSLKSRTDFIIACLHFGKEFRTYPDRNQIQLMQVLFHHGVNVVLGAHPHVLHPIRLFKVKDIDGLTRNRVAASSLGNFVSTELPRHTARLRGTILMLTLTKNAKGITDVLKISRVPTRILQNVGKKNVYRVVPDR